MFISGRPHVLLTGLDRVLYRNVFLLVRLSFVSFSFCINAVKYLSNLSLLWLPFRFKTTSTSFRLDCKPTLDMGRCTFGIALY